MPRPAAFQYNPSKYWCKLIEKYVVFRKHVAGRAASTIADDERTIRRMAIYLPDNINDVTPDMIATAAAQIWPSPNTWNYKVCIRLRAFWTWAVFMRHAHSNPVQHLKRKPVKYLANNARRNLVWREAVEELFAGRDDPSGARDRHVVRLLYWTGMRPTQVNRLRPDDIRADAKRPFLIVNRGKVRAYACPLIHRDAIVGAQEISKLVWSGRMPSMRAVSNHVTDEWTRRFPDSPKICMESFRHTRITEWIGEGYPVEAVAKWCGTSPGMIRQFYLNTQPSVGLWPDAVDSDPEPAPKSAPRPSSAPKAEVGEAVLGEAVLRL
jgi:integrase